MDKHTWRQVKSLSSTSLKPSSRWGHSCCVVGQDIVFFGGYADSNYMNDLWAFNSVTMKWRQIQTFGDIPCQRSNCTMNYDKENNQIVIFGGGGINKQRFNSINILDWNTKNWIEINPKENEVAPWQRTYHSAQFLKNYLIIFGGQGVADLDDLWIFNFQTLSWTEVKINEQKIKPCARRFHSSVLMGNEFIVLAGCHSKYRCLNDVYSMDLTSLIKTGSTQHLSWKEKKFKNSAFLTRWGHSSAVYDNKIYIFGGRFSNDLNDLLVADVENNIIRAIKTNQQAPPARRRHCSGFIGSSMLVFGGFNGQYFQDLYYISVHEAKTKNQISVTQDQSIYQRAINNDSYSDSMIMSTEMYPFKINIGLIAHYFDDIERISEFLEKINNQYSILELSDIFMTLYKGYGDLKLTKEDRQLILRNQNIPETKNEKMSNQKQKIQKNTLDTQISGNRKLLKKATQINNLLIKLNQQEFTQYYIQRQMESFADIKVCMGKNEFLLNKIKIMTKCSYFLNLLNKYYQNQIILNDILGMQNKVIYEIFFNYLQSDWIVIPDNASIQTFKKLSILADYYCVPQLFQICCNQLMMMINLENVEEILNFSLNMYAKNLSKACADFWIKKTSQSVKFLSLPLQISKSFGENSKVYMSLLQMYDRLKFDLFQIILENEKQLPSMKKKDSSMSMQKQNYELNIYLH